MAKWLTNLRFWLFIITFLSACFASSNFLTKSFDYNDPLSLFDGWPYAAALMFILLCHEMGHFVAAKWWGFGNTKGPLFIPMPFSVFGTFGAFIALKDRIPNRKALFDVGAAGPWAGLFATGIVILIKPLFSAATLLQIDFAVNVGLFVTFINLLPLGYLDGGHVFHAAFGGKDFINNVILRFVFIFFAIVVAQLSPLILVIFVLLAGFLHSPTEDDREGLDGFRNFLAGLTAILFLSLSSLLNLKF